MADVDRKKEGGKKKKQKKLSYEEQKKTEELENFLFGGCDAALDMFGKEQDEGLQGTYYQAAKQAGGEAAADGSSGAGLALWEDRAGARPLLDEDEEEDESEKGVGGARRPVWEDPSDAVMRVNVAGRNRLRKLRQKEDDAVLTGEEYEQRLRKQHATMHGRTSWASLRPQQTRRRKKRGFGSDSEDEEGSDNPDAGEALLMSAGNLLGRSARLAPTLLETSRVRDANQAEPSRAVVRCTEFHPGGSLLMTAGLDKRVRFFEVDGVKNAHVQSLFFKDMPVFCAAFANGGQQVVASGRRKFFYVLDLGRGSVERVSGLLGFEEQPTLESFAACASPANPMVAFLGTGGTIPLLSLRAGRQPAGVLKMSGTVTSATFNEDGSELLTSGGDGVVHTWDMRMLRCVRRDVDEGNRSGTALAVAPNGRFWASGSSAGVVNVYRTPSSSAAGTGAGAGSGMPQPPFSPRPEKALMNLTTTITSLTFSPDSQLLAMGSPELRDGLRLVHLPSCTVFSNWPTSRTPLNYVHSVAFSPRGGYLAVGNAKGRVLLYRLHHYPEA